MRVTVLIFSIMFFFIGLSSYSFASEGVSIRTMSPDGSEKDFKLYSGYYALVIGCGDYREGWPMLPNPVKDTEEVAKALKALGFEVRHLKDADHRQLRRALNELVALSREDTEKGILVFFAGHGHTLTMADGSRLGYLIPVDAPDPDIDLVGFMDRAVSMQNIEQISMLIRAKHVLMVFDSCFSGALFALSRAKAPKFIEEQVSNPVRLFITAGNESEKVPDQSHFKKVFIQGLLDRYADLNRDNYVTGQELGAYLQEQVVNYTKGTQHPQFGKIRNPELDKGDFVFKLKPLEVAAPSPENQPRDERKDKTSIDVEISFWESIKDSRNPAMFEAYLNKFPDGVFAVIAGIKVEELNRGVQMTNPVQPGIEDWSEEADVTVRDTQGVDAGLKAFSRKGRLYVNPEPRGARVRIMNIRPRYQAGMELDPGKYLVEVSLKGYKTFEEWVELYEGEVKEVPVHLVEIRTGGLRIESEPEGALIEFDRPDGSVVRQNSPFEWDDLLPGLYRVRILKAGFEDVEKEVIVAAGERVFLNVYLIEKIIYGELFVNSEPPGAEIFVEGRKVGVSPHLVRELSPGFHVVSVQKEDYEVWKDSIEIEVGKESRILATLNEKEPQVGDVWVEPKTGIEFVWVPKGCYEMGCGNWNDNCFNDDEKPVHEVCLDGFWMGKYEVTQGQWLKIMGNNPSHFKEGKNYPVEQVSWEDAKQFIQKLNSIHSGDNTFHLPTEAEWEYTCRSGGKKEQYSGGNKYTQFAWTADSFGGLLSHAVGTKLPNQIQIFDMSGNVWEWCEDKYNENAYRYHNNKNPIVTYGNNEHVVRGGSWNFDPWSSRCVSRHSHPPDYRSASVGFRLVRKK